MLETLEELQPRFKRIWQQKVPLQELTVLAIHPTSRKALVLTNRKIYLLEKKFFGISFKSWGFDEVKEVAANNAGVVLAAKEKRFQVDFCTEKLYLRKAVAEKINESIKKSR